MKAAIFVTLKPQDGLQNQVEQAYALVDQRGWEMVRMVHQDELADEAKLDAFFQAVQAGEFQVLAVPTTEVFSERVVEALKHFNVSLEVYDPAEIARQREAEQAKTRKETQTKQRKQAALETMANEPWKAKLMEAFLKKGQ